MSLRNRNGLAVLLRAVLLVCCAGGIYQGLFPPGGGFMTSDKMLYFTYQSNLCVLLLTAVYFVLGLIRLIKGDVRIPRALSIARYSVAVAITITFLVFWLLLSPALEAGELMTLNNQLLHTIVPLLFLLDFLLFDRGEPVGKYSALWAVSLPLYYFGFSLLYAAFRPEHIYEYGGRYPYFFLNLDTYGWFGTQAGMGVLWWVLLLCCGTLCIGYGYRWIQRKTARTEP